MQLPVTILTGFLGSGKTTLLRKLLQKAQHAGQRIGLIVNEMSELDVDGMLLGRTEAASQRKGNLISLPHASIGNASMLPRLDEALRQLQQDYRPDHVIIETSGSTRPSRLIEHLNSLPHVSLRGVFCLLDAVLLKRDFADASSVIPGLERHLSNAAYGLENLLAEQVMFASKVLLTHADVLTGDNLHTIGRHLAPLNPYVDIAAIQWGNLPLDEVLQHPAYDFQRVAGLIEELKAMPQAAPQGTAAGALMSHQVIIDDRPFHPQRLWECVHQYLDKGIQRSKGFFWLASRPQVALLWNQSGDSIGLEVINHWAISALEDSNARLLPEERELLKQKVAGWHSRFGDRRCELTIIGAGDAVARFCTALKACLLSEQEIAAWQQGAQFADPWPHNHVEYQ